MEREGGGIVLVGRAEIDTRAPFRSVKEAIVLFGERVLVGEVYANKLNEMRDAASKSEQGLSMMGSIIAELEETKQSLEKARGESLVMAHSLSSLQDELQETKKELQKLKARESEKGSEMESDTEDVKFVENGVPKPAAEAPDGCGRPEVQKRRYVKFASPPSLAQVMTVDAPQALERQFSDHKVTTPTPMTTKKKKPLIPVLGRMFSKKKGHQEVASPKGRGL